MPNPNIRVKLKEYYNQHFGSSPTKKMALLSVVINYFKMESVKLIIEGIDQTDLFTGAETYPTYCNCLSS